MLKNCTVYLRKCPSGYPFYPYHPDEIYPELLQLGQSTQPKNHVYRSVRNLLQDLKLDQKNINTPAWDPFGSMVKPGGKVVIKPNWVMDTNPSEKGIESLITHTSVIRPLIDYCILALKGKGSIILADAPLQRCDFSNLVKVSKVGELVNFLSKKHPQINFSILDLRKTILLQNKQRHTSGDPQGYTLVNLGQQSLLTDLSLNYKKFRVTKYNPSKMSQHHNLKKHEYLISQTVLSADLVINTPKIKTHIKAGMTGAMKNVVGINGHKEYLPHHMKGSYYEGGDQYLSKNIIKTIFTKFEDYRWQTATTDGSAIFFLKKMIAKLFNLMLLLFPDGTLLDGGWFGNQTLPRTIVDLNNILYFWETSNKKLGKKRARNVLTVVDAVICGQSNGPLRPIKKPLGYLAAGYDPVSIDVVFSKIIGYDIHKLNFLFFALSHFKSRFCENVNEINNLKIKIDRLNTRIDQIPSHDFTLPRHWLSAKAN